ncbi:hypothetical protein HGA88_00660 [Candidatus Roizmanbacteria bacterium]|nr:hypothetical protein [Candidatus Roizmanbacteria bacterium]
MPENSQPKRPKRQRIIVNPVIPMKFPAEISKHQMQEFINTHHKEFKSVIYMGWVKRIVDNKRRFRFIIVTADNSREARQKFRKEEANNVDVWDLTD